jgi:threonylcarbamoyladenosine tRNA methylthiotransferase MtaB
MKTYAIQTLGCKVNQYESQQIRQVLEQSGLTAACGGQKADIVVVNTCCVTHIASAKSRQNIRKSQNAHPDAKIIVTGCLPAGQDHELNNLTDILIVKDKNALPVVLDRICGQNTPHVDTNDGSKPLNPAKIKDKNNFQTEITAEKAPDFTRKDKTAIITEKKASDTKELPNDSYTLPILDHYSGQCRAFLKIQDGCDAYCTYCIIPKIRTNVCNKNVKTVIEEAKRLIASGHREIVLTGIFLGAYGQITSRRKKWDPDKQDALADLVEKIAKLDNLPRLRLSSLEPKDVTDRLLSVMTSYPNIMPHLHLPLQAGSVNVLKKMARQYTIEEFREVVGRVKSAFDRPAITTDIIVGFPGESQEDFNDTMELATETEFSKIHVFSFSPRKNTPAEKMIKLFGAVSPQEIKRRSAALQRLDDQLQQKFRDKCVGLAENVLVEKTNPPAGRCSRYFMVDLTDVPNSKALKKGQTTNITIR